MFIVKLKIYSLLEEETFELFNQNGNGFIEWAVST